MITSVIGVLAAVLTTVAYVPQAYKTWKTQSTEDLSLGMFLLLFLGTFLWLCYGVLIGDFPLMLANGITCLLSSLIFYCKLRSKAQQSRPRPSQQTPV